MFRTLRALLLSLALVVGVAACDTSDDTAEGTVNLEDIQELQSAISDMQDSIDSLANDDGVTPARLLGQEVTVNGAVEEVLSPNLITVTGDDFWQFLEFEPAVLVSAANGVPGTIEEGDVVQLTGTVDLFQVASWESTYGIDYDDELVVDYENQLALADTRIENVDLDDSPVDDATDEVLDDDTTGTTMDSSTESTTG